MSLLRVEKGGVMYGGIVGIAGLEMEVEPSRLVALLGPNGAGKSSALRVVSGEGRTTGRVVFDGRDVSRWATHRRAKAGIGHVRQGGGLFRDMTVDENLSLGAYGKRRADRDDARRRVFELFPRLEERRRIAAGLMSGGEQQMLALGRALMADPKLILLDEPTLGLSPIAVTQAFERIAAIRDLGISLILVDQNAPQALRLADHVYVVKRGRIVLDAPAAELEGLDIVEAHLGLIDSDELGDDELEDEGAAQGRPVTADVTETRRG